jgi:Glycolipid 2-alpha-mannosyltransferase
MSDEGFCVLAPNLHEPVETFPAVVSLQEKTQVNNHTVIQVRTKVYTTTSMKMCVHHCSCCCRSRWGAAVLLVVLLVVLATTVVILTEPMELSSIWSPVSSRTSVMVEKQSLSTESDSVTETQDPDTTITPVRDSTTPPSTETDSETSIELIPAPTAPTPCNPDAVVFLCPTKRVSQLKTIMSQLNQHYVIHEPLPDIIVFHEADMPRSLMEKVALSIPRVKDVQYTEPELTINRNTTVCSNSTLYFVLLPDFSAGAPGWQDIKPLTKCATIFPSSYMHMCRFFVHDFFQIPIMNRYRYAWRLDTDSMILSPIRHSFFEIMRHNSLSLGYALWSVDSPACCDGLGAAVQEFTTELRATSPALYQSLPPVDSLPPEMFPKGDLASYNPRCKLFNTNFVIWDLDILRTAHYAAFAAFIDKKGGIYSTRWGDHIVLSIYIATFFPPDSVFCAAHSFSYAHKIERQRGRCSATFNAPVSLPTAQ